jgi:hypothetical protein
VASCPASHRAGCRAASSGWHRGAAPETRATRGTHPVCQTAASPTGRPGDGEWRCIRRCRVVAGFNAERHVVALVEPEHRCWSAGGAWGSAGAATQATRRPARRATRTRTVQAELPAGLRWPRWVHRLATDAAGVEGLVAHPGQFHSARSDTVRWACGALASVSVRVVQDNRHGHPRSYVSS